MRALDWSSTLGPVEGWPQSLRSAVSILLPSRAQIVLFWGRDLVALYNDAYRPVFGAKHPWALGRPARDCWREIWHVLGPLLEGVVQTGQPFWAQDHPFFLDRQGYIEETYFDVSYDPVRIEDGSVGGVFCIVSETTGRVVSERRLRTLRELGGRTGEPGTVADVYREAAGALATNPGDLPFALIYSLEDTLERATLVGAAGVDVDRVAGGGAIRLADVDALRSAVGDRRTVTVPASTFVAAPSAGTEQAAVLPIAHAGQPIGMLVAGLSRYLRLAGDYADFLDLVAARVSAAAGHALAYEAERRRNEALAELDRAKTAFFSNVSHEFRTPLTLMLGPLEAALTAPALPEDQRAALGMVHRNGVRLLKLVNTLLEFSRIEAGRVQATFAPVDLAQATVELASVFRAAVEAAGLRLVVDCPALSGPVWVDREMWEKIVLNLISNAFKFTFDGTIAVRLGDRHEGVVLEVVDTGVGIAAADLPHVFERFHRVRPERARSHEGTGIGLALVKELVALHAGTITIHSEPDQGTRVRVTLPRGTAHLPPERLGAAPTAPRSGALAAPYVAEALRWLPDDVMETAVDIPPAADAARLLVVDDNADMRNYLRGLLAPHWVVETAGDGEAALEAARARPFDLVVTDVMMPRLDGYGLLGALRADPATRTLPVIVLSARAGEESRIEGLERGADDYLVKPFSARELIARVNAQLVLARGRREATEARTRLLEQERRLRAEAEAANQAKDHFLAMLAHELRNPLGVILNGIRVLDRLDAGADEGGRVRSLVGRQAHHLARLLDDLLDVARISQGKIVLRRETLDLRAVVDLALQGERHRMDAKRQRLAITMPSEPVLVHGDPARLQQVVSNLVNNASKYTEAGGDIAVEIGVAEDEVRLVVRDSGAGIPAQKLESIFELFVQLDTPLARSEGGLGIGLTLVRRLVEQHDGRVEVHSAGAGAGSTFTVTLPLAAPMAAAAAVEPRPVGGGPRDVLLIEDNDDAREALRLGLEMAGHRVRVASDGASGIAQAMQARPDVAVIDVGLPGLDGYQVAQALRQKLGRDLLLVALTGYGQSDDRRRAREAGFDVHLTKPAGVEELERVLGR